ncbi:hypothetical protein [Planctopirus ephydatiae]|uniref:hypothetical protein n=1 Tax=Planctopirus ephydatiae TaxID=2528019 RepID=UPI0011A562EF|nr:hypothetical protein [Planctopirus ephydatiae]
MKFIRRSHQKSVAIFFDNLDRRSDDIQEQAFLRAAAMANDWGVLVFVCLRPGTMQRSSAIGLLDTMAPRTLIIPQPDIGTVLRKRFQYASQYAARSLPSEAYPNATLDGEQAMFDDETESRLPEASRFFLMCDQSIHRNPALAEQYRAVSNGNIRKVMDYVKKMITSRHLDTHKILSIMTSEGDYTLAPHESLRAMIYGPFIHFEPNASLFTNLFDILHTDPTEHFSRVLILDFCQRHANSVDRYGFINVALIQDHLASLGYSINHVNDTLLFLFKRDCVEGPGEYRDRERETPVLGTDVRITSVGSFHISTLVRTFEYIDAIAVDTPVLESQARASIKDVRDIRDRLKRARLFARYLERQVEQMTDSDARKVLSDIFTDIANDITDIEQDLPTT